MAVGDVWAVRPICAANNQLSFNVLHYLTTASVLPEPTPLLVANDFSIFLGPGWITQLANPAVFVGVQAQKVFPAPPSVAGLSVLGSSAGTAGPNLLPTQVCGIITKLTAFAGRRFRGRVYMPFPSEEVNTSAGAPTGPYLVNLAATAALLLAVRTIINGAGSATFTPVLFHRPPGSTTTALVGTRTNSRWATQRRRGPYGQPNVLPV